MKNFVLIKLLSISLCFSILLTFAGCSLNKSDDIIILFTGDTFCSVEENIGFSGVSAYKTAMLQKTPHVSLVDLGNAVQGKFIGSVSKGNYIVDIMNKVGYDFAVPGNYEFDYGLEQFTQLTERAKAKYLISNATYTGTDGVDAFENTQPYQIVKYGNKKVAFIGVTTPKVILQTVSSTFTENDVNIYDLKQGDTGTKLYNTVQGYVNECRNKGADYVIILSHLGDTTESVPYTSTGLINATFDVDAVLDAHSGNAISNQLVKNKNGIDVILASPGKELLNIGQLSISKTGNISVGLVSGITDKDSAFDTYYSELKTSLEDKMNEIVGICDTPLSRTDLKGHTTINNRENILGNFCADAYRIVADADIGLVSADRIRGDLPGGDITYSQILDLFPFRDKLSMVYAMGQEILDALEVAVMNLEPEYEIDDKPIGESLTFLQVSGIKFTVDTSVKSSVEFDDMGMFKSVDGKRRVKNVMVMNEKGNYTYLDPKRAYSVATDSYLFKNNDVGMDMFSGNAVLIANGMPDYQVVLRYLTEYLNGRLSSKYASLDGRIIVE